MASTQHTGIERMETLTIGELLDRFPSIDPASVEYHDGKDMVYNVDNPLDPKLTTFRGEFDSVCKEVFDRFGGVLYEYLELERVVCDQKRMFP